MFLWPVVTNLAVQPSTALLSAAAVYNRQSERQQLVRSSRIIVTAESGSGSRNSSLPLTINRFKFLPSRSSFFFENERMRLIGITWTMRTLLKILVKKSDKRGNLQALQVAAATSASVSYAVGLPTDGFLFNRHDASFA